MEGADGGLVYVQIPRKGYMKYMSITEICDCLAKDVELLS
jgi:hypothetical protein